MNLHHRVYELDPDRDLSSEAIDENGRPRILPAAFWAGTTRQERALLGLRFGIYSFPTVELVEFLRRAIGTSRAIEIGAGNGVLAAELGIPATDNRMQEMEKYRTVYALNGQATVPYGDNIVHCDAKEAIRRFRPDVVIGCWVTHRYEPDRHWAGGNEIGIDEERVLRHCRRYIVVGNRHVHAGKKIWGRAHSIVHPSFVYSRAINGSRDFIATWPGQRR